MTEHSKTPCPSSPARPQRLRDTEPASNDLGVLEDPLAEEEEHGRIGYGRLGERTPYVLAALIILTIVIAAAVDWFRDDDEPDETAGLATPQVASLREAPDFQTTLLNGQPFDLSAYRGKVVVLNFWATWCEPCKKEMPVLQDLATANPDDVVVLGLTTDPEDKVNPFLADMGITYPIAIDTGGNGPVGGIGADYKILGYPSTFIIDPAGNISVTVLGPFPLEEIQSYVDQAAASPT